MTPHRNPSGVALGLADIENSPLNPSQIAAFQPESSVHGLAAMAGQARRDRLRIVRAERSIAILQAQAAALLRETQPSLRQIARNMRRLLRREPMRELPPQVAQAPLARARALVIDHHWPAPDRDSGSIDIVNLVQALGNLGFDVLLAASEASGPSVARDAMEALGIHCLRLEQDGPLEDYIARHGAEFDLCVLCRVYCGGAFLEAVQTHCGKARIVFNAVDLNFLREERRARLQNDQKLLDLLPQIRAREEHIIRESDATILVSDAEMQLTEATIPEAFCLHMPLARPILPPVTAFEGRRGIGFIGGFAHAPNVDAIRHFLADIWPLLLQSLPDCELSIVGAGLPAELLTGCPGKVRYLGYVADIAPWFESLRLTIAPLRFGAGAKGKIASSLAAGVPAVLSDIAAEGMALQGNAGVLQAANAAEFANAICHLHEDPLLWSRLSGEGLHFARRNLSLDGWQARLGYMLQRLGF